MAGNWQPKNFSLVSPLSFTISDDFPDQATASQLSLTPRSLDREIAFGFYKIMTIQFEWPHTRTARGPVGHIYTLDSFKFKTHVPRLWRSRCVLIDVRLESANAHFTASRWPEGWGWRLLNHAFTPLPGH